ncbi:unnamed protein product, partial [Symbiodinium necroappetens]
MAQFEKLCAVSDGTIDECVQAFVNLEELARWVPMIEILFALVRSTAKAGTADLATDLGFGLAEIAVAIETRAEDAQTSLKARELGEEEMNALRSIVYESGGFRSQNINAIPLTTEVLVKYVLDLADRGCGPTVIPSVRGAVKWICKRIGLQAPDLLDARMMALQKRVYGERGKETREAVPIPLVLVASLERFVCARFRSSQFVLAFFAWWILIMIYSSLRFDDAMHVVPE